MIKNCFTRRKFFKYLQFTLILFLTSCSNFSKNFTIGFQKGFISKYLQSTFPNIWNFENIKLEDNNLDNSIYEKLDFVLINDGWINKLNFNDFQDINTSFFKNLDNRSLTYLDTFPKDQKYKLFPVGLVPYCIVVKNNNKLKIDNQSWDFLLSKRLEGKIILPNSSRVIISIAKRMKTKNSLKKLLNQVFVYDDKNALDWLINTEALLAIVPLNQCKKYLKIDSRLSLIFPDDGVPLSWYFAINKFKVNESILFNWINSLDNPLKVDKLLNEGWYLPFKNVYIQNTYEGNNEYSKLNKLPSNKCWENSWSFSILNASQKQELERGWSISSTP